MNIYFIVACLPISWHENARAESHPMNLNEHTNNKSEIIFFSCYFYYYSRTLAWFYVHIWETQNTFQSIVALHTTIKMYIYRCVYSRQRIRIREKEKQMQTLHINKGING